MRRIDAGVDAHRGDEVVDGAGGDAVDVGLHDHRVERLVDAPARFEELGEERSLAELRDADLGVAGLRGQGARSGAVAVRDAVVGAFVAGGADLLGGFGVDQRLERLLGELADEVGAVADAERVKQFGQGGIGQGHRCGLLGVHLVVHIEHHADGSPRGGPGPLPETPPLHGTHTRSKVDAGLSPLLRAICAGLTVRLLACSAVTGYPAWPDDAEGRGARGQPAGPDVGAQHTSGWSWGGTASRPNSHRFAAIVIDFGPGQ